MSSGKMSSATARLCRLLLVIGFVLTWSSSALAAKLRTEVPIRKVGIGQSFEVKVTATHKDAEPQPSNPQLKIRGQATVQGPSVGTRRSVTMRNFSFDSEQSIVATWIVTPTQKGKLVIGPGTFTAGGKTLRGETIVVEVVEEPQRAPRRSPFGGGSIFGPDPNDIFGDDPFDMFKRGLPSQRAPEAPKKFQVETAPHPISFLRLVADKQRVVLGQPIRLTVVAYGSRGNFREVSPNEPSLPDFLSYSVIETSHDEPAYQTTIEGQRFIVRKLREYILIPLKTGSLRVGGMTAVLQGGRGAYPNQGSPLGMKVVSPDLTVEVVDAPLDGRPDGYFPGDVGIYMLEADVNPRTLKQGEYAEVLVRIKGVGQIPSRVLLPEGPHVTWEPPTLSGGPEIRDGKLQGTRVLKYAVQLKESGEIDLGEITLPYYQPWQRRYRTARAELGTITVESSNAQQANTNAPAAATARETEADAGVPFSPRSEPGPYRSSAALLLPRWIWWVLVGLPAALGSVLGIFSWLSPRLKSRKSAEKTHASQHLREAKRALSSDDPTSAYRFLEKAIYEALDRATGQKTRGHLREHLARELSAVGFDGALSEEVQAFLSRLDQMRYDESARGQNDPLAETRALLPRIQTAGRQVSKKKGAGK